MDKTGRGPCPSIVAFPPLLLPDLFIYFFLFGKVFGGSAFLWTGKSQKMRPAVWAAGRC